MVMVHSCHPHPSCGCGRAACLACWLRVAALLLLRLAGGGGGCARFFWTSRLLRGHDAQSCWLLRGRSKLRLKYHMIPKYSNQEAHRDNCLVACFLHQKNIRFIPPGLYSNLAERDQPIPPGGFHRRHCCIMYPDHRIQFIVKDYEADPHNRFA